MASLTLDHVSKLYEQKGLPPWITEAEHQYYVEKFQKGGFRGPINRYRNMDTDWQDIPELQAQGVAQVFLSGTSIAEIVDYLMRESARA